MAVRQSQRTIPSATKDLSTGGALMSARLLAMLGMTAIGADDQTLAGTWADMMVAPISGCAT